MSWFGRCGGIDDGDLWLHANTSCIFALGTRYGILRSEEDDQMSPHIAIDREHIADFCHHHIRKDALAR